MGFALKKITSEGWFIVGVITMVQLAFTSSFVGSYAYAYGSFGCESPLKDLMYVTIPSVGFCCNNKGDPGSTENCVTWDEWRDNDESALFNCYSGARTVTCEQDDVDDDYDKGAELFTTYYSLSAVCLAIVVVTIALIAAAYFIPNMRSLIQLIIILAQFLYFVLAVSALSQPGQDNSVLTCDDVASACDGVFYSSGASTTCGGISIIFTFAIATLLFVVPVKFKWCCCCMCFDWDFRDVGEEEAEEVVERAPPSNNMK